jgi:hypothetical protein
MIDYAAILSRRYFGKEWILDGDSYEGLTWNEKTGKPSKATLDDLWPEVIAEIAAENQAKEEAKISAQSKLAALGLTADEIAAIRS